MIGPEVVDDATVQLVLDLALRVGELQLGSGAGVSDVTATMLAITDAYGLPHCEVDVIFTSITVCCHRGVTAAPVTSTRVVRFRSLDYTRLDALDRLVTRIIRAKLAATDAHAELATLSDGRHTYPRWASTMGWAGMGGAIAVLFGGNLWLGAFAAVVTALIDRIGRILNRRALPFFFQQIVGAAVVTASSVALDASGLLPDDLYPGLVVAAGLTVLLSGLSLVGTMQDAITGFYVTAAGRAFEVALLSVGLVAGVAVVLQVGDGLGVDLAPPNLLPPQPEDLWLSLPAAAAVAALFSLASYAPPRAMVGAALAGAASWGAYVLALSGGLGATPAAGLGAVLVGLAGRVVSRRLRLPPLVLAVSGITPLLPGLATYRGVLELTVFDQLSGVTRLLGAMSVGVALAAGVVLGEFLAQPVRTGLGRLERRLAGPRLVGPMRASRRRLE